MNKRYKKYLALVGYFFIIIKKGVRRGKLNNNKKNPINIKFFATVGLTAFLTFVACICVFFLILRYDGVVDTWHKVLSAGQPIIIGLVLAYLLNPILKKIEYLFDKYTAKKIKNEAKRKKMARGAGIIGSIIVLIASISLLLSLVLPALISNITSLTRTLPGQWNKILQSAQNMKISDTFFGASMENMMTEAITYVRNWAQSEVLSVLQKFLTQITSGAMSLAMTCLNIFIGLIVMVYVMGIKEKLVGQCKMIIYTVFKTKRANVIVDVLHKANEIFSGFISGKIIDSVIVGIICYIGCLILSMPNATLVAVMIGVTNVIPMFGPYIGTVPSIIIVAIQSPIHAVYLLIFLIILQQVDGNIIGPKIIGSSTGLSSFWVMFAILIGSGLFGFIGMLISVPVFAVIYDIIKRIVHYILERKKLPLKAEDYTEVLRIEDSDS